MPPRCMASPPAAMMTSRLLTKGPAIMITNALREIKGHRLVGDLVTKIDIRGTIMEAAPPPVAVSRQ